MEKKLIPPPKLPEHLQKRLDELKALQAKEKEDGVEPGTYTSAIKTTAGGNATRKHTDRAKKKSQKNRRK